MRIWALAWNTFGTFWRDRLIIVFLVIFACLVLFTMSPLMVAKAMTTASNAQQMQAMVLGIVSIVASMASGFGSLLAAWLTAGAVTNEIKSGTILAVMARPVRRWEFLLAKFLGAQILLAIYVVMMLGLTYVLAWLGGEHIHSARWVFIVYPMVRYAIYSAIALLLATVLRPAAAFGVVFAISVLAQVVAPTVGGSHWIPQWLQLPLWAILPSTSLLSETRFLAVSQAALKQVPWTQHAITLAYGLDYALVFMLLAMWSFHYRSLTRD